MLWPGINRKKISLALNTSYRLDKNRHNIMSYQHLALLKMISFENIFKTKAWMFARQCKYSQYKVFVYLVLKHLMDSFCNIFRKYIGQWNISQVLYVHWEDAWCPTGKQAGILYNLSSLNSSFNQNHCTRLCFLMD